MLRYFNKFPAIALWILTLALSTIAGLSIYSVTVGLLGNIIFNFWYKPRGIELMSNQGISIWTNLALLLSCIGIGISFYIHSLFMESFARPLHFAKAKKVKMLFMVTIVILSFTGSLILSLKLFTSDFDMYGGDPGKVYVILFSILMVIDLLYSRILFKYRKKEIKE